MNERDEERRRLNYLPEKKRAKKKRARAKGKGKPNGKSIAKPSVVNFMDSFECYGDASLSHMPSRVKVSRCDLRERLQRHQGCPS